MKPEKRYPDSEGQHRFTSLDDAASLSVYLSREIQRRIRGEPDGILSESICFHRLRPELLEATPFHNDDNELRCSVDAYRSDSDIEKGALPLQNLSEQILPGTRYRDIVTHVEEAIAGLPSDGLAFLERHAGIDLPENLRKLPSTRHFMDNGLHRDTRYSDCRLTYELHDLRFVPMDTCLERAQRVLENIYRAVDDTRFAVFYADVSRDNPWRIRIHRMRLDYVKRFMRLLRAAGLPKGARLIGEDDQISPDFDRENMPLEQFYTFQNFAGDFSPTDLMMCRSTMEQLLEETNRLLVEIGPLRPSADDDDGIMPNPDGVCVTYYKQIPSGVTRRKKTG